MSYDYSPEQEKRLRIETLLLKFDREEPITHEEMMFLWAGGIFMYADKGVKLLRELKEW